MKFLIKINDKSRKLFVPLVDDIISILKKNVFGFENEIINLIITVSLHCYIQFLIYSEFPMCYQNRQVKSFLSVVCAKIN